MASGVFSSQQILGLLNESITTIGQLKPSLFSRGTTYAKTRIKSRHHEKAASHTTMSKNEDQVNLQTKKRQAMTKTDDYLPKDWVKLISVPNTHWITSTESINMWKNESHVSADTFDLNKRGYIPTIDSKLTPFTYQRMSTNRRLYLNNIQKRFNSSYITNNRVMYLEDVANEQVNNANVQADYLKAIIESDPEYVIRRYESGQFASNDAVKDIYMKALLMTNQLSPSEAQRRFSKSDNGISLGRIGSSNSNSFTQQPQGTEDQPVHVVMNSKKGSFFKEQFWNTVRFGLLVGFLLYGFTYMQTKMLNVNQKEILPDQSEKNYKFEDVQGCDEAKQELEEVVEFLRQPEKFEKLGAKLPGGVLLIGPPGTGKTLLARAIAGEADVPFFFASGSEFDEMFVGVGAARVRKLFAAAKEHAPCIIFIDELDAIGGTRVSNDHQPYSRMTLNQLLVELDGFDQTEGIIVIGATNFPEILDKALTRPGRFDSKVFVTMPDVRGRIAILDLYLKKSPCADDVDSSILARGSPGFSGADLANLVNQAALRAASTSCNLITMEHFEWAKDKIMMGPERKSAVIAEENRKLVAYHESGHAIVAIFTPDAQPVHKATVIPRGSALGYVMQLPEKDELSWSKKQLLAKMDVCMGGRVAEEMIFGEDSITTGASSDMQQATKIARAMVTQYGMSEKVGTVLIDEQQDRLSPDLQSIIEGEVKRLIQEAYIRAKTILYKHAKEHKRLAEGLLKYETLNADEVQQVIKGYVLPAK